MEKKEDYMSTYGNQIYRGVLLCHKVQSCQSESYNEIQGNHNIGPIEVVSNILTPGLSCAKELSKRGFKRH